MLGSGRPPAQMPMLVGPDDQKAPQFLKKTDVALRLRSVTSLARPPLHRASHCLSSPPPPHHHRSGMLPRDHIAAVASPHEATPARLLLSPPPRVGHRSPVGMATGRIQIGWSLYAPEPEIETLNRIEHCFG